MITAPLPRLTPTLTKLTGRPPKWVVKKRVVKQISTRRIFSGVLPAVMAIALAGAALSVPTSVQASSTKSRTAHATNTVGSATAKTKRHRVVKPKVDKGSSTESTAERDRRLKRECRGMPNAGACLGYTR